MQKLQNINKMQLLVGGTALIIGLVFYLIARPPGQLYIFGSCTIPISFSSALPRPITIIADSFPAFIHVFAFSLLTAAFLPISRKRGLFICVSWYLVNCIFELGQKYKELSSSLVPNFFADIPFLDNARNFFLNGTFDSFDFLAFIFGGLAAYLFLTNIKNNQGRKMQ